MTNIYGEDCEPNFKAQHIEKMSAGELLACLDFVLDPAHFQFIKHMKGDVNRNARAEVLRQRLQQSDKHTGDVKKFLIGLEYSDSHFETDIFYSIGDEVPEKYLYHSPKEWRTKTLKTKDVAA